MTFTPRPGRCEICGKEMMVNSAVHKYCKECRNLMRNSKSKEFREKEIARRVAIRRGTDPDRYKGLDHECKVKGICVYGSHDSCMYMAIEGHSRLLAGYPIRGGKCDLFKTGKKKVIRLRIPESHPSLSVNKVREV